MNRIGVLVGTFLLGLFAWAPDAAGSELTLRKEWQVTIGPLKPRFYLYRTAVCPDGSVYFTDREGRLGALAADGRVAHDQFRAEWVGATAIA